MNDNEYLDLFNDLSRMGTQFYRADKFELSDKAVKINNETLASASSFFSMVPWIATKIGYRGALIAEVPEDMHLAKDAAGKLLGTALSNETNQVAAQARFSIMQPKGADIVSAVFSVMSIVTGQYYMHMNSLDMGHINGVLKNLEGHIEAEKYSELCQENETLRNIAEDYRFIVVDEDRMKNSRLIVEEIVNKTSKNNEYYKRQIQNYGERFKTGGKNEISIQKKLENFNSLSYKMVFNLYNHGIASFMYMMLYNIRNKEEIYIRKERLENKWDESIKLIDMTYHDFNVFMDTKEYDKIINNENMSLQTKIATHLFVPAPLSFVVHKGINNRIESKKDVYSDGLLQSWEAFIKFKSDVSPLPMVDNYIEALGKRKLLIKSGDDYYLDIVDNIETLTIEAVSAEELKIV